MPTSRRLDPHQHFVTDDLPPTLQIGCSTALNPPVQPCRLALWSKITTMLNDPSSPYQFDVNLGIALPQTLQQSRRETCVHNALQVLWAHSADSLNGPPSVMSIEKQLGVTVWLSGLRLRQGLVCFQHFSVFLSCSCRHRSGSWTRFWLTRLAMLGARLTFGAKDANKKLAHPIRDTSEQVCAKVTTRAASEFLSLEHVLRMSQQVRVSRFSITGAAA